LNTQQEINFWRSVETKGFRDDQTGIRRCISEGPLCEIPLAMRGLVKEGAKALSNPHLRAYHTRAMQEHRRQTLGEELKGLIAAKTLSGTPMSGAPLSTDTGVWSFDKAFGKNATSPRGVEKLVRELLMVTTEVQKKCKSEDENEELTLAFMTLVKFQNGREVLLISFTEKTNSFQLTYGTQCIMPGLRLTIALHNANLITFDDLPEDEKMRIAAMASEDIASGNLHRSWPQHRVGKELTELIEYCDGKMTLPRTLRAQPYHSDLRYGADRALYSSFLYVVNLGSTPIPATQLALCQFGKETDRRPWVVVNGGEVPTEYPTADSPYL
jgi:hypothetical protein